VTTISFIRDDGRQRRLMALVLLAWLSLLVRPCAAGLPSLPVEDEPCHHGEGPEHVLPCASMQAVDCEMSAELNADASPSTLPARPGVLLALLPPSVGGPGALPVADLRPPATGPPLNIRFCNLRN
jgi:hypothetical protein